ALIGDPDILMLDEATLGVDAPYETYIYEIIYKLQKEKGLAIMLISHEFEVVYKYTSKVLCLNKKMFCFGAPEHALTEGTLAALYKDSAHYHHHHESE
ncbi:MAG: ABC transporter ATP-binding protein, partial [Candidatus Wolfebacteria bacterium]|nr:ABC transporter ATP-binding protein [Candidatus Wolfebacteria bacterium]